MTNWTSLLSTQRNRKTVENFASGGLSGRQFYSRFKNTELGGEVRNLLRTYTVAHSRSLARKALNRR